MSLTANLNRQQCNRLYLDLLQDEEFAAMRLLCQEDLFFLLTVACQRHDIDKDWLYDRCREVEAEPYGNLDLWAREHYKSTIITFGMNIKDVLNNPELTVCIFSHTRPIAKAFLYQIKSELEQNAFLHQLFPDVLYAEPRRESPRWGLDTGLVVKRTSNPREATFEAWGLVDGQPIGMHFGKLNYDDVVVKASVATPEQIKKTNEAWELSVALGAAGGVKALIGTRYHFNDTWAHIMDKDLFNVRIKPSTDNGKIDGLPVFMDPDYHDKKRREMGSYVFACQMLQAPNEDSVMGFKQEWLRYYTPRFTDNLNIYLLVDPAGAKKKGSDYTVMLVIGLGPDNNYYLLDGIRDRLNLTEKAKKLFYFHRKWRPINVGYEKVGMQADIEHISYEMDQIGYHFSITALPATVSKDDRIQGLIPVFELGRFWLPYKLLYADYEGKPHDLVQEFVNDELLAYPVSRHDDMLDAAANILHPDLRAEFPLLEGELLELEEIRAQSESDYDPLSYYGG